MERVAFLVEPGQQRIGCLLNPESLVSRRYAGIRSRHSVTGPLTGAGLKDDPLLSTGGGRTELELDLLFDVSLAGSSIRTSDVRDLTLPLWNLAENAFRQDTASYQGYGRIPVVRFIWGKSWNLPCVVVAVAERLERFTSAGVPQRSWLRLRLVRVAEPEVTSTPRSWRGMGADAFGLPEGSVRAYEVIGGLGLAEEPMSLAQAFVTASGLIAEALESNGVAALLADAAASAHEQARAALAEMAGWIASGGSSSLTILGDALREVMTAAATLSHKAATPLVSMVLTATKTISRALGRAYSALAEVTSEVSQAGLEHVRAALDAIRSTVMPLAAAVGKVAREVRTKAATLIAAASNEMTAVVADMKLVLGSLAAAVAIIGSAMGSSALEAGRTALATLGAGLAKLRATGTGMPSGGVADTLGTLAKVIETLYTLGEYRAATALQRGVEAMAFASRTLRSSQESLGLVSWRAPAEALRTTATALRNTATELRDTKQDISPDVAARIQQELMALCDSAVALLPAVEVTQAPATAKAVIAIKEAVAALTAEVVTPEALQGDELASHLEAMVNAAQAAIFAEEAVTVSLVQRAFSSPEAQAAGARQTGGRLGERLEHIAYRHYGDPAAWRVLATSNQLDNPFHLPAGHLLRIVPLPEES